MRHLLADAQVVMAVPLPRSACHLLVDAQVVMAVPLLRSVLHLLVDARVVVAVPLNTRQFNQHRYSSQHRYSNRHQFSQVVAVLAIQPRQVNHAAFFRVRGPNEKEA